MIATGKKLTEVDGAVIGVMITTYSVSCKGALRSEHRCTTRGVRQQGVQALRMRPCQSQALRLHRGNSVTKPAGIGRCWRHAHRVVHQCSTTR